MFCSSCGKEVGEAKFCPNCGAGRDGVATATAQPAYKAPNFEFKTVRCYPSDYQEQRYKEFYEGCGWTILDMDRKQQYTGQSSDGTKHYSTQTHIKMQRDKNHPNYEKIAELSEKAEKYFDTNANTKKVSKTGVGKLCIVAISIGPFLVLWGAIMRALMEDMRIGMASVIGVIAVGIAMIVAGIVGLVLMGKKLKKSNAEVTERYNKNKVEADAACEECKKLVNQI